MANTPRALSIITLFALLALSAEDSPTAPKMLPDAPVTDFQMPFFDPTGKRIMLLTGKTGHYISPEEIRVQGMILRLYNADAPRTPHTTITSTEATLHPKKRTASGPGYLLLTEHGGNYSIAGRDWLWNGPEQYVLIKNDARVTFREDIGSLLSIE